MNWGAKTFAFLKTEAFQITLPGDSGQDMEDLPTCIPFSPLPSRVLCLSAMQLGGINLVAVSWVDLGRIKPSRGLHCPSHSDWFGDGHLASVQGDFAKGFWDLEITR